MELNFKTDIKSWLDNLEQLDPLTTGFCPNLKPNATETINIKAIVFDIYGTLLISSSGDIDQASLSVGNMEKALVAGGFKIEKNPETIAAFILEKLPEKIKTNQEEIKQKGHPFPDIDIFKVWREMLESAEKKGLLSTTGSESLADTIFVFEILSNKVFPMPGMKEILTKLNKKGIPLGIVSNAQFYTPILMNYFLSGKFSSALDIELFDPELSVFSFKELRGKPDVSLFQKFIPTLRTKYNINPRETIFVGNDMLKDVYAAQKAGLKTVLFAGDERSLRLREDDERVKGIFPDFIITDLKQLLDITE
ncbi:HAD family hydrolase [Maribellus maritimus]|uniref:HAD family hydrolase n=1 Tax=Maribellus maritimus TaxID=2870838 RepID=UPI001EEA432F|nr:HAD family hydrolase [Maribellus maritimus]MCG6190455.1 HAD family hydrolase [Maribellus maritimus]